tara:strand:+ start:79644 stop:80624 length:981 start_codon:yes stop_codon:yes gene_type:complete
MGDAAGTGPEIITKTLTDEGIRNGCRPIVIGDADIMKAALKITGMPGRVRSILNISEAEWAKDTIEVFDLQNIDLGRLIRGEVNIGAGQAAYEYIKEAANLCQQGEADGMVTSAINKESLNKAGHHFDGHTELLAKLCGIPNVTMMLVVDKLRICHVSTHVSLRKALDRVRPERILKVIELAREGIKELGIDNPHIAIAGLNPHAGENGLFGDEEVKYIQPAIEEAISRDYRVSGPYPGDTIFFRALQGHFDGVVAMYHDQGHVAAKMLGIWRGVNVTLGLPIIRTSVEHGTSFDKAGKGTADPRSMNEAIKLATSMVMNRKGVDL